MRFKSFLLCSSSAALFAASPAWAQTQGAGPEPQAQEQPADPEAGAAQTDDAVEGTGEEIVVTGLRRSLQSAQNIKRNSEQIVDTIVAEDIGKLPDIAVSETAARIPGVQVIRRGGEADAVLIRGLPDFTTTYNGREIFTAEARVVALQDFPSANIAALEVFKASTANLVEPGLAGLVNVRSRRPFDFKELHLAGSIWALHTKQAGETTPNFNLLYSDRWDVGGGEVGLLVNVSRTELSFLDSEPSNTDFIADPVINGQRVRFPDIQRLFYRSGNRVRPSLNAMLQWRPAPGIELYVEGLYQGFRNKIDDRLVAVPLYNGGQYSNLKFRDGTNLLESGTITGLGDPIFTFQGGTFNKTDTYQFAIGGSYDAGPLRISADVALTDSTFRGSTESVDRIFAGQGSTSVDFDLRTPQFTIRNFDVNNPANYLFDGLYEEDQESQGDDLQARIDAEYEMESSFVRSLQFGARYSDREAHREFGNRFFGARGRNIAASLLPLDFELNRRGFRGTDVQSGFETFLTPTYGSIRENREALRQFVINLGAGNFTLDPVAPNPGGVYDASERTVAGYGQVNYAFGDAVDGAIGLRVVRTNTEVEGAVIALSGALTPVSVDRTYTDFLPNASLRWRVTPELQLRLSATQTRTRPNFGQLNPGATLGAPDPVIGNRRRGDVGNPLLEQFKSDNFDASLEYYFSRNGFAAVSAFRRNLDGFIQPVTRDIVDPIAGPVRLTFPINTGEGRINGLEAQFQTFFDFEWVPTFLRNFGVQANYTYLDAKTEVDDPFGPGTALLTIVLPENPPPDPGGVSKHTYNLVAMYEGGGLSTRLSYNKRGRFLDRRDDRGDDVYIEEARPAGRLDLSTSYTISDNFTVFFDWTNILEDPLKVDFSSGRGGAPRAEYVRFLRFEETTMSLGVRFRL
jgi:TonB-dependent receptor